MPLKTTRFDPSRYVETIEDAEFLLKDAFESGDLYLIRHTLGVVLKSKLLENLPEERTAPDIETLTS